MENRQFGEIRTNLISTLIVGWALVFKIAQIDEGIQLLGLVLDLVGRQRRIRMSAKPVASAGYFSAVAMPTSAV